MLRRATPADMEQLIRLRGKLCREEPAQARAWLREIIGLDNLLVVGTPPQIDAVLATVAVEQGRRRGIWFGGMLANPDLQDQTVLPRLVTTAIRAFAAHGYDFVVTIPATEQERTWLTELGFQDAFSLRELRRSIARNLWAQADFDAMTVRRLQAARQHYQPHEIALPDQTMTGMIRQLYARGITLVSNPRGYGLFYTGPDALHFVELHADNDHCADILLQAARNQTGVENAHLLLAEAQSLYLGQGKRFPYGMIRFLNQPFPLGEIYFRSLL